MARPFKQLAERLPRPVVNRAKHYASLPVAWNLDLLGVLWGTDKPVGHHAYTPHDARHLRARRRRVRCVLEIGIGERGDPSGGGNSLRMWRSYFPKATIYGIDLYEKHIDEPRIVALQADQSDAESLLDAVRACPPFDLIVDDGSHVASHVVTTFETLFPRLRRGGLYVIEDLETAYWPEYEGGPPGTAGTSVALVKSLLDDLNAGGRPVGEIHAYLDLDVIRKRESVEAPARPSFLRGSAE
jgi:hypothetical protein